MDTPNPRYLEERNRVMVGNLPDDFLRFNDGNQAPIPNGHSQYPSQMIQQQDMASQPMMTQIVLTIAQAELTKSYSLTKMDPYVRVRIGHAVYETHTSIRGGKFPHWNKVITSYLSPGVKTIHFEIFDECTLTPDERIAYADLVIPDEVLQGKTFDESIPLSGKQGIDKEGFLNITICIRSVPCWPSMAGQQVVLLNEQKFPYRTRRYPAPYEPEPHVVVVRGNEPQYPYWPQQYPMPNNYMASPYQTPPMANPNFAYPAVQPQPYCPSEEEIKQMQEMFPAYDREVIISVLENCHGNKDQAITSLLSLS